MTWEWAERLEMWSLGLLLLGWLLSTLGFVIRAVLAWWER